MYFTAFYRVASVMNKFAGDSYIHFYIALGILKLKKYPKSPGAHATLHIFFKKRNFFRKIFFG